MSESVTLKATEKIIEQMNNSIYRISNTYRNGTRFFVKIPYKSQLRYSTTLTMSLDYPLSLIKKKIKKYFHAAISYNNFFDESE